MLNDNEFHPAVLGADNTDMQDSATTRIGNALSLGIPAAAISGGLSIVNTALDWVGQDMIDTQATVDAWNKDAGVYYRDNKEAVDLAGFVVGSFVPGTIGVKALKLARAGKSMGAIGEALSLPASRSQFYLKAALAETAESGGVIKNIFTANRARGAAWEVADQGLTSLAFELGVAGLMHDSPVFDNASASDFMWNGVIGVSAGGLIGGAITSIMAKGILNDASKAINLQQRALDTVLDPDYLGKATGTGALELANSMLKLSDATINTPFRYRVDGKMVDYPGGLPTAQAFSGARKHAVKTAEEQLAIKMNELAGGNAIVGQANYRFIVEGIAASKAAGRDADTIIADINGYLNHVESFSHVDPAYLEKIGKVFYATLEPTGLDDIFSSVRIPGKTGKAGYTIKAGTKGEDLTVMNLSDTAFPNAHQVWKSGIKVDVLVLPNGRRVINPHSEFVKRVSLNSKKITKNLDLSTGTISDEAIPHFADIMPNGRLTQGLNSIETGGKIFPQKASVATDTSLSALEGSARWAWATKFGAPGSAHGVRDLLKVTQGTIDYKDLPLLHRVLEIQSEQGVEAIKGFSIREADGSLTPVYEILDSAQYMRERKWSTIEDYFMAENTGDLRHLAAHVNTSVDYIEEAIRHNFSIPTKQGIQLVEDSATVASMVPKTIAVTWNFSDTAKIVDPLVAYQQQFGPAFQATRELSLEFQRAVRARIQDEAFASALGNHAGRFMDSAKGISATTGTDGAGASLVASSNAGYTKDGVLFAQSTGKAVDITTNAIREENIGALTSFINKLREKVESAAELGILTNLLRKSEFKYKFEPDSNRLISTEAFKHAAENKVTLDEALDALRVTATSKPRVPHMIEVGDDDVAEFLKAHTAINSKMQEKMKTLYNATGQTVGRETDGIVYAPAVNTVKYPYHAFVRTKEKIGIASETTMITARSADDLRKLTEQVDSNKYDVLLDQNTANYHKAKGDYDYSMGLHEARINSDLERVGKLTDFLPETRAENVLSDYIEFHGKQAEKLVRNATQVKYRDFFSEMTFLSSNYRAIDESVARGIGGLFKKKIKDPFNDVIKTSLNISKQQEFPLIDKLNEFVDAIGVAAGESIQNGFGNAAKGNITWQEADAISARYGMGKPFEASNNALEAFNVANAAMPPNIVKTAIQKVNTTLANFTLRLDAANSLINMLSTSIMTATEWQSIKGLAAGNSELEGLIKDLVSVKVPGQEQVVPSFFKTIYKASTNFWAPDSAERMARYKSIGAIQDVTSLYREQLNGFAIDPMLSPKIWIDKVNAGAEKLSKYTGSQFSEDFTRFVSADMMAQLTDPLVAAGKLAIADANAYINVFVNRTQGNYVTSQKPIIFQGTTGAAVSLFQTYAFNVLQQLHRHVEKGDKKTLAMFAGMQSTIFGMNGLPFFDAVNTHLIGSLAGNPNHKDMYSVAPAFNKELGDWMLYGTASAFPLFSGSTPALYTRGDINPRSVTVIPTNIVDVPAVSASIKLVNSLTTMGKNIVKGADISDSLLQGLEHQGISRPLAGFAQLLAGRSTTSKGSLVSAANDLQATSWLGAMADRVVDYGGVSRVMGARPMNEAVALNNLYRNKGYEALDRERLTSLGIRVKASLYGGEAPSEEELNDFMRSYAASGGRIENFNQAMVSWQRDATVSIINETAAKLNTSSGRNLRTIMGADYSVPDYSNQMPAPLE